MLRGMNFTYAELAKSARPMIYKSLMGYYCFRWFFGTIAIRFRKQDLPRATLRQTVRVGPLVRTTPGLRHGWFESNVGLIRKPLS